MYVAGTPCWTNIQPDVDCDIFPSGVHYLHVTSEVPGLAIFSLDAVANRCTLVLGLSRLPMAYASRMCKPKPSCVTDSNNRIISMHCADWVTLITSHTVNIYSLPYPTSKTNGCGLRNPSTFRVGTYSRHLGLSSCGPWTAISSHYYDAGCSL